VNHPLILTGSSSLLDHLSTNELIALAQKQNRSAFEVLYKRLFPLVMKRLTHMMGDSPQVNDLLQDTFIQVYLHLGSYRGEQPFHHYVIKIASNLESNYFRQQSRSLWKLWQNPQSETPIPCPHTPGDSSYPAGLILSFPEIEQMFSRAYSQYVRVFLPNYLSLLTVFRT